MAKTAPPRGKLAVFLRQGALHKGLLGGSPGWRTLFFVLFGGRALKRAFGKAPEIVTTEKMKPGQLLQIETIKPPTRKEKKAAARAVRSR